MVPLEGGRAQADPVGRIAGPAGLGRAADAPDRHRGPSRGRSPVRRDWRLTVSTEPLAIRVEAPDGRLIQQIRIDGETGAFTFHLGDGPGPRPGRRRPAVRSARLGRSDAERAGGIPAADARRPRTRALADRHQRLGDVRPSAGGTFDLTGTEGRFTPAGPPSALPLDLFIVTAREPVRSHGRVWLG